MRDTAIQWCHHTFNAWIGCTKVSPGCKNCYAEALDRRWGNARWGKGAARERTSATYWRGPLSWNARAAKAGERHRVFCASLADVFDTEVNPQWRVELLHLILNKTPHLDWLLLTKRPENILPLLEQVWMANQTGTTDEVRAWLDGTPPKNVWLGTTVEDQQRARERIPQLLQVPAAVHFLSCEPLLERVDLRPYLSLPSRVVVPDSVPVKYMRIPHIDWVIVGGESGPGARPFNAGWARHVVAQCRAERTAVFVKQLGANVRTRNDDLLTSDYAENGWFLSNHDRLEVEENLGGYRDDYQGAEVRIRLKDRAGGDPAEWPNDLRVREFPRAA